jgi:phosphoribosylaminoimidazole-succinocarboxamide synthase
MTTQAPYLGRDTALADLERIASGKVRDIYRLDGERLLFVTTDRVSAFDVVMDEGVPYKGCVLTAIAAWWFENTRDVIDNHLLSTRVEDVPGLGAHEREALRGRIMIVEQARPTTVEWVVRGYIAGSGWKEYKHRGTVCGIALPAGLELSSRLPEPILTPTTKDEVHDLQLSPAQARERVGAEVFETLERASLALFARGTEVLAKLGILLADTKFEFGERQGRLVLIDEALTPDSSRFWPADQWKPGTNPPSYDKQILRDHLEGLDWNKQYPPPAVDAAVFERIARRYLEICRKITGSIPEGVPA